MTVTQILLAFALLWYGLYVAFLAYCAIMVANRNGKLKATPWPVRWTAYSIIGVAVVLDVAFNVTIGSLLFLEAPNLRQPLFTQRCKSHLDDAGWRGDRARWICSGWLNPFDAGHC